MIDYQRIYHQGMAVSDINAVATQMAASLNLEWSPIRRFDPLPFWTPDQGMHEVTVDACYSRKGPQHLELVQGTGPFYDPANQHLNRHIGIWVDDIAAEANRLLTKGWTVLAAGASPDDGFGIIAYMQPPTAGITIELVSTDLGPIFEEWISASE